MAENLPLGVKLQVIGTEEYKRAMSSAEQSTQKYEKEIKNLEKQFPKAASASKGLENQTKSAEQATKQATRATKEAGDQASKSAGMFGQLKGALMGAAAGFTAMTVGRQVIQMIGDAIEVTKQYQSATFNLQTQMQAAEREFGLFEGKADSTGESVKALADEFRVFSDRDVATAQARLIQMTKRLGLTEQEIGKVLRVTADLSAAQGIDLASGVERVAAALRGEAESAEYLGLTLNDTWVASQAVSLGFEDNYNKLTNLEKTQVRLAELYVQTNDVQGTAAESANTLAGAQGELNRVWERLQISLGTELLPTLTDAVTALAELTEEVEDNRAAIAEWLKVLSPVISKAEDSQKALGWLADRLGDLGERADDGKGKLEDFIDAIAESGELEGFRAAVERIDRALDPYNEQIIAAESLTRGFFNTVMWGLSNMPGAGIFGGFIGGEAPLAWQMPGGTPYAPGGRDPMEQAWQPPQGPSMWGGEGASTQQAMADRAREAQQDLLDEEEKAWEDQQEKLEKTWQATADAHARMVQAIEDRQADLTLTVQQQTEMFELEYGKINEAIVGGQRGEDLEREIGIKIAQGFATPEDQQWWEDQRRLDAEREKKQAGEKLLLRQEHAQERLELDATQAGVEREQKVALVGQELDEVKTTVETKEGEITEEIDDQYGDRETDFTDHMGNQFRHLQDHYEKMKAFIEANPLPNFDGAGSGAGGTTSGDGSAGPEGWTGRQFGGSGVYGSATTLVVGEGGGRGISRPEYVRVTPMGAGGGTTNFVKNYQQQVHMNMGTRSGQDAGAIAARVQSEMSRGSKLSGDYGG